MRVFSPVLAGCAAFMFQAAGAAQPGLIDQPSAAQIPGLCAKTIKEAKARIEKLKALPLTQANAKTVLTQWNQLDIILQDTWGPIGLLKETSPRADVRKSAEACDLELSALPNAYLQSEALYQRVLAVKPDDAIDAAARQSILDDFTERGVSLAGPARARVKAIFDRLDQLGLDYNRNTRDAATKLAFPEAALQGVPANALKGRTRDAQGNYVFGLDYPELDAIMQFAEVEATRKAFSEAFGRIGGQANLDILKEAVGLRLELARLFGDSSFADWNIKRRMAGSAAEVRRFLTEVYGRVETLERTELEELRQQKAMLTGAANAQLHSWDTAFYTQRLKKARYSVDQNDVRAQFPTEPTVAWMMKVTSELYGVTFKPKKGIKVWHPEVRGYDVFDTASGKYMSSFYLDMFPRDGKYKHAAAFPVRGVSLEVGRTPVAVLVTNFSKEGFDQEELDTLFHEFGHIMHMVLSKTRYVGAAAGVKWDFVEAPSQMYEAWSRRPETLALFAQGCPSCKPIDTQLIARMNEARKFGVGRRYATQWRYASFDIGIHDTTAADPLQTWIDIANKSPLGYTPGNLFPANFGHMMGGYQAGYYGYMWSEVLAMDMRSAFGNNFMDKALGARYRTLILQSGGERPAMELVSEFLGRKPNADAFFREITGQK